MGYTYRSAAVIRSLLFVPFQSGVQLSRPLVVCGIALLNVVLGY